MAAWPKGSSSAPAAADAVHVAPGGAARMPVECFAPEAEIAAGPVETCATEQVSAPVVAVGRVTPTTEEFALFF